MSEYDQSRYVMTSGDEHTDGKPESGVQAFVTSEREKPLLDTNQTNERNLDSMCLTTVLAGNHSVEHVCFASCEAQKTTSGNLSAQNCFYTEIINALC